MLRIKELQNELKTLVGWRQDASPIGKIDEVLTQSDSGIYYQDAHPLLTLENIRSILPVVNADDYAEFSQLEQYKVDDIVSVDGEDGKTLFICIKANTGLDPLENPEYWKLYNQIDEYLKKAVDKAVANVVNTFVGNKVDASATKTLLEHKAISEATGRLADKIVSQRKLVGFEIEPIRGFGVTTQIHKIGLQMAGAVGAVKMYLFHTSQSEPIKTFEFNVTKQNGFEWFPTADTYLPYMSDENNAGGQWYLCYHQDELPYEMEAVNTSRDWSKEPCRQCGRVNSDTWRSITKYVRLSPFSAEVDEDFSDNPVLPDFSAIEYTPTKNYGLNMEISVGCDLTGFIISQKYIFANVLQVQMAVDILRSIAYNPEVKVNRNQLNVAREDVIFELDGNQYTRSGGLIHTLGKIYKELEINTRGLDSVCLACSKHGIKLRSV